jgi:integrase
MPRVVIKISPKRSGGWTARKRIPKDVSAEYSRLYGQSSEAWFSVGPMQAGDARREAHEWAAEVEARIKNIRAARTGVGQSLTRKEALALAGVWYRWFIARYEDDAGDPQLWETRRSNFWDDLEELALEAVWTSQEDGATWKWLQSAEARPQVRAIVADEAKTAQFLVSQGLTLSHNASDLFLDCVAVEFPEAMKLLERRASNDYTQDRRLERFPKFEPTKTAIASDATPLKLFEHWVTARKPAPASVDRWRPVFLDLEKYFPERSANSITADEAQAWADALVNAERSPNTVNDVWCNAAHTVFAWAVKTKKISSNPFKGVKVTSQRKIHTREGKHFTDEEIAIILSHSAAVRYKGEGPIETAKRWVPWLCAYTGARGGEITQLRGADVIQREGHWAIYITPEAGTTKTRKPRTVPLHEHLLEQGFLAFVRENDKGPLFYNVKSRVRAAADNPMKPPRPRSVKTLNRIGEWVRSLGVTDKAIRPNHAWRHTFQRIADRSGIQEKMSDAITGHAPASVGRSYGTPSVGDMAEALKKFPRYSVSGAEE